MNTQQKLKFTLQVRFFSISVKHIRFFEMLNVFDEHMYILFCLQYPITVNFFLNNKKSKLFFFERSCQYSLASLAILLSVVVIQYIPGF